MTHSDLFQDNLAPLGRKQRKEAKHNSIVCPKKAYFFCLPSLGHLCQQPLELILTTTFSGHPFFLQAETSCSPCLLVCCVRIIKLLKQVYFFPLQGLAILTVTKWIPHPIEGQPLAGAKVLSARGSPPKTFAPTPSPE